MGKHLTFADKIIQRKWEPGSCCCGVDHLIKSLSLWALDTFFPLSFSRVKVASSKGPFLSLLGGWGWWTWWGTTLLLLVLAVLSLLLKLLYQYHAGSILSGYSDTLFMVEDIFMSVLKLTNFLSFLCKIEVRELRKGFTLFHPDLVDSSYLCPKGKFTSPKVADIFTPVISDQKVNI